MAKFNVLILLFCLALVLSGLGQTVANSDATGPIEAARRTGDFNQALQLAQTQLQRSPKNATLWTLKGIALSKLGRDKEALTAYNTALSISPEYLAIQHRQQSGSSASESHRKTSTRGAHEPRYVGRTCVQAARLC